MFDPIGWLPFRKLRLRNRSVMVVSAVWLLSVAGPFAGSAGASIITTGDVDPGGAATQPDPWAVGANLYVGKTGTGALNVAAGGVVSSSHGYLGYSGNSSSGEVTVTGSGSQWTSAGNTFVGYEGNGELTISNGASASYVWSSIGGESGSSGSVVVSDAGSSWTHSAGLMVGYSGTGELTVSKGASVSNTGAYIGNQSGSTGEATVTGTVQNSN